jgi:hypothetical protein
VLFATVYFQEFIKKNQWSKFQISKFLYKWLHLDVYRGW